MWFPGKLKWAGSVLFLHHLLLQGNIWQNLPPKVYWSMAIFHTYVQGRQNSTAHHDNKLLKWKMQVKTAKKPWGISLFVFVLTKTQDIESLLNLMQFINSEMARWGRRKPSSLGHRQLLPQGTRCLWIGAALPLWPHGSGSWRLHLLSLLGASCLCSGTKLFILLYNLAKIQNWTCSSITEFIVHYWII